MLTFTGLARLTEIEREIGDLAKLIAGADTGHFLFRTNTNVQVALKGDEELLLRDALIAHYLRAVHKRLDEAKKLGVDVDAEKKAWLQKGTQLLPTSHEPA